jgi:hypothetical protein
MQNVVGSLAIATFATVLQARLPVHLAEVAAAAGGQPSPAMLTNAAAFAFGDVYRTALVVAGVAWLLVWTLRRVEPPAHAGPKAPAHAVREPALVAD